MDYRGEIGVIVINLSNKVLAFEKGERVAQIVFNKVEQIDFIEVFEAIASWGGLHYFTSYLQYCYYSH